MKEVDTIFGFPIIRDKENKTATIQSDCNHPFQSSACKSLYKEIEKVILQDEKVKFPLDFNEWQLIIEPSQENLIYYSYKGLLSFIEQYKNRIKGTITFFKPEIHYRENFDVPVITLHFYEITYDGKLVVKNIDDFISKCLIPTRNIKFTPDRIRILEENNINVEWMKHIPFLPMEPIKFDNEENIKDLSHQKLNLPN